MQSFSSRDKKKIKRELALQYSTYLEIPKSYPSDEVGDEADVHDIAVDQVPFDHTSHYAPLTDAPASLLNELSDQYQTFYNVKVSEHVFQSTLAGPDSASLKELRMVSTHFLYPKFIDVINKLTGDMLLHDVFLATNGEERKEEEEEEDGEKKEEEEEQEEQEETKTEEEGDEDEEEEEEKKRKKKEEKQKQKKKKQKKKQKNSRSPVLTFHENVASESHLLGP